MIGVLSDEVGVRSVTTNWNTKNASRTVMLRPIFSSESAGSQNTCSTHPTHRSQKLSLSIRHRPSIAIIKNKIKKKTLGIG